MPQRVYVATNEPNSGKSLVTLGVMEVASRRAGRLAYFRPVIRSTPQADPSLQLMRSRYRLPHPPEAMFGADRETVRRLLAEDRYDELLKTILEKFKALEEAADFILCEGTSFHGLAPAHEFDLNADIAANLGAGVLQVIAARDRSPADVMDAVRIGLDRLADHRCDLLGTIVNHVPPDDLAQFAEQLDRRLLADSPLYLLPAEAGLDKPTVGEIATALQAQLLSGERAALQNEVRHYLVAAMQLPNFLDHLREGSLIVTPGDRADILIGSLAALASRTLPNIAAVILTGGLTPPEAVMTLLAGLPAVPLLSVKADTFTTATAVAAVPATLTASNDRKIASALNLFETNIDIADLESRIAAAGPARTTPLMFEYELIRRARANRQRIVLPEGTEPRILQAADILLRRRVADLTLLGNADEIRRTAAGLGVELGETPIIEPATAANLEEFAHAYHELRKHKGVNLDVARDRMSDVSYYGTMLVHLGLADGMVSGAVHTTQHTIRPAFEFIKTRPGVPVVSSVFFMCLPDRVLVYGDCAVNPNPTAEELAWIAIGSAETAAAFGVEPRVAMLSYSTGSSGKGEDVERVRQATELVRGLRPELPIEGPIQYDAAVDAGVARTKLPGSSVAGRATIFIFPDLNTGNNTYKAVQRSSGAVAIGPVLQGLNKPVNDLSRGCTITDIVNTVAITALQAQCLSEKSFMPQVDSETRDRLGRV